MWIRHLQEQHVCIRCWHIYRTRYSYYMFSCKHAVLDRCQCAIGHTTVANTHNFRHIPYQLRIPCVFQILIAVIKFACSACMHTGAHCSASVTFELKSIISWQPQPRRDGRPLSASDVLGSLVAQTNGAPRLRRCPCGVRSPHLPIFMTRYSLMRTCDCNAWPICL